MLSAKLMKFVIKRRTNFECYFIWIARSFDVIMPGISNYSICVLEFDRIVTVNIHKCWSLTNWGRSVFAEFPGTNYYQKSSYAKLVEYSFSRYWKNRKLLKHHAFLMSLKYNYSVWLLLDYPIFPLPLYFFFPYGNSLFASSFSQPILRMLA